MVGRPGENTADSSLGVCIASQDVGEDSATVGILSALASGTFLYVATMELLPDCLAKGEALGHRLSTNCAICAGAVAFGSLARWT